MGVFTSALVVAKATLNRAKGHPFMTSDHPSHKAIKDQMELVLDSPDFQASPRLKKFFRFLGEEALAGRASQLKGYTIATTVFERPDTFDAQADPIVRVEAAKLRSRLEHYYYAHKAEDHIYISLPKGGYIPEFSILPAAEEPISSIAYAASWRKTVSAPAGVAVLPFVFTSDGDRTDYFSDGLAEEITVHLTKFEDLTVASSYSTRQAWINSEDMSVVAKALNVRFLLHGSVKITGDRIRVIAELVDCDTRSNVWADKFDGCLTANDLFSIQDEIVHQVTSRIADSSGQIKSTLFKESGPKPPEAVDAYDAILGYHHWAPSFALDRFKYALEALERTVAADPDYALPAAMLSDIYASDYQLGYDLRPGSLDDSLILANRAVALNSGCQFAYWALALNYFLRRDQDRFQHAVTQIIPLNPANTYTMAGAGLLIGMAEDLDKGNAIMQKAVQLNPKLPSWFHIIPFMVHYKAGDYEAALTEALQINTPDCFWDPMLRAAAYGRLGLGSEAEAALKHLLVLQPAFIKQQELFLQALLYSPELVDLIRQGLTVAGLKI